VLVLVASAMLSASYLIPVFIMAFYTKNDDYPVYNEVRKDMLIPIVFTGLASIVLGIFPDLGFNFYELAVQSAEYVTKGLGG
jgi:multicomponent Na+:H+ antiporter subunit D